MIRLGLTTAATTLTYTGAGHSTDRVVALQGTTGGATLNADGTGAIAYGAVRGAMYGAKTLTLGGTSGAGLVNTIGLLEEGPATLSLVKSGSGIWRIAGGSTISGSTTKAVQCSSPVPRCPMRSSTGHGSVPRVPRFAVPADWLAPRMSDAVRERFERTLEALRRRGALVEAVDAPMLDDAWRCYTPIVRAEGAFVHRAALAAGGEGFSELVIPPLREGEKLLAGAYLEALRQREGVRAGLAAILSGFDAMLLPTSPVLPPLRGQTEVEVAGGRTMPARDAVLGQTAAFSLVGLPTLAMPMGDVAGLPTSLQVVGAFESDARVLAVGRWIEAILGVV